MKDNDTLLIEKLYTQILNESNILERAFHGSPHDIVGSFDLNKIGSGEGNQIYGWGLYFAENKNVAQSYKDNLSKGGLDSYRYKGKEGYEWQSYFENIEKYEIASVWEFIQTHHTKQEIADMLENGDYSPETINYFKTLPSKLFTPEEIKGNLYEVDIDADKENDFLDWDKSIDEQSDLIKKAFENIKNIEATNTSTYKKLLDIHGKEIADSYIPEILKRMDSIGKISDDGKSIYKDLSNVLGQSEKAASETLLKQGVKGIRYLDQSSRGNGEGTYNYVIFDPSIIKIISKNGKFLMKSKTPENVEI